MDGGHGRKTRTEDMDGDTDGDTDGDKDRDIGPNLYVCILFGRTRAPEHKCVPAPALEKPIYESCESYERRDRRLG